ncbi:MAG: hypothetical protein E7559_00625 [Ruminococcaceae bacterium]|nr:hypothetical protein [Oscillospiraceae bacterium]
MQNDYKCAACGAEYRGGVCPFCGVRRPVASIGRARDRCYTEEPAAKKPAASQVVYEKKSPPAGQGGIKVSLPPAAGQPEDSPLIDRSASRPAAGGAAAAKPDGRAQMPRRSGIPKPPAPASRSAAARVAAADMPPAPPVVRRETETAVHAESDTAEDEHSNSTATESITESEPISVAEQTVLPAQETAEEYISAVIKEEKPPKELPELEIDEKVKPEEMPSDGVFRSFGRVMGGVFGGSLRSAADYIVCGGGEQSGWLTILLSLLMTPLPLGYALWRTGICSGALGGAELQAGITETNAILRTAYGCFVLWCDRLLLLNIILLLLSLLAGLKLGIQRTLSLTGASSLPLGIVSLLCAALAYFSPAATGFAIPGGMMIGFMLSSIILYIGAESAAKARGKRFAAGFALLLFLYASLMCQIVVRTLF